MITIAIFIPWFAPSYKAGGPIQSIVNLVDNNDGNYRYFIFTGNKDVDGTEASGIKRNEWITYSQSASVWYSSSANPFPEFKKEMKRIKPDLMFVNGIYSLQFNFMPILFFKAGKKILSARGMLHPEALSQKSLKKRLFITLLKALGLHKKVVFHATNKDEKIHIENVFGKKAIVFVAANFPRKTMVYDSRTKEEGKLKLITVALVSPMKNHDLVIKALKFSRSEIEYQIIGAIKDNTYWQECMQLMKDMPANVKVVYHGEQRPESVQRFLADAHVFVMPSKSENYGHAIIEALQSGLPVITSRNTPWNHLEENHCGINVQLTESALTNAFEHFAQMSQQDFNDCSKAAQGYATNAVDLFAIRKEYSVMFENDNNS